MRRERSWMYNKNLPERRGLTDEFRTGVDLFLEFASNKFEFMDGNKLRCPCKKCKNCKFQVGDTVGEHLYRFGFTPNYYNWTCHGEPFISYERKYDELAMSNASGGGGVATSEQSVNSKAVCVEASSGIKRRKIFGKGSSSRAHKTKAAATPSSNVTRTQLEEIRHSLEEMDEKIRVLNQQLQFVMRYLDLHQDEFPLVPPTNLMGDEHNDGEIVAVDDDGEIVTPQPPSR